MIFEVANFREEGLVTPKRREGEKVILNFSMQGIEPGCLSERQNDKHYIIRILLVKPKSL